MVRIGLQDVGLADKLRLINTEINQAKSNFEALSVSTTRFSGNIRQAITQMGQLPKAAAKTTGEVKFPEDFPQLYSAEEIERKIEPRPHRRGRRRRITETVYKPFTREQIEALISSTREAEGEALELPETVSSTPTPPPSRVPRARVQTPMANVPPRQSDPTPSGERDLSGLGLFELEMMKLRDEITEDQYMVERDRLMRERESRLEERPKKGLMSRLLGGLRGAGRSGRVTELERQIEALRGEGESGETGGEMPAQVQRILQKIARGGVPTAREIEIFNKWKRGESVGSRRTRSAPALAGGNGGEEPAGQRVVFSPTITVTAGSITSDEVQQQIRTEVEKIFNEFEVRFRSGTF